MEAVSRIFNTAASGAWPTTDLHGEPWAPGSRRAVLSGTPLSGIGEGSEVIRGILCEVSCDLDEYTKTLGMPHYNANYGCMRCFVHRGNFADLNAPVRKRTHDWFRAVAPTCMHQHPITDRQVPTLVNNLRASR